ncbi:MAG: Gfo/Idh/MocA family oxidoreductase [Armatimonadetes bacterium]|nr:Gfo/Idh/MocA family oxidoreductase [Armatimonadota bacterium]
MSHGVQLTFNHQRRYLEPFRRAREILKSGAVGPLRRLEAQCADLYDWGTHWIDMLHFYNDETPAEWVIAQIDSRTERKVFGVPLENQGLCHIKFANGVRGTLVTGHEADIGCANRITGDEGVIEVGWDKPVLRTWSAGQTGWTDVPVAEGIHDHVAHERAAADIVQCLDAGGTPLLSSNNALRTTEVIFAAYESSRFRGRIDLPLTTDDSALLTMLEEGAIGPDRKG